MATVLLSIAVSLAGMALQALFAPKPKTQYGPRVSDLNIASISPGNPIIRLWGTMKLPGQILWNSRLIEVTKSKRVGGSLFSKGQKVVTYTYFIDAAFGVCVGPINRFRRIRANQKLIWVNPDIAAEIVGDFEAAYLSEGSRLLEAGVNYDEAHVGAFFFAFNEFRLDEFVPATEGNAKAYVLANPLVEGILPNASVTDNLFDRMFNDLDSDLDYETSKIRYDDIVLYLGHGAQLPSPLIESYKGVGNVSGYRGLAYFTVERLQLEDFGNSMPTMQAEVEMHDGGIALVDILTDICLESGLAATDFDATFVPPVRVQGFASTAVSSARTLMQDLQNVYPFDGAETAYTIRFNSLERRPCAIVDRFDFAAHVEGEPAGPAEEITRAFDYDLPKRLNFTYQEPVRNFSTNTVSAFRTETESNTVEELEATLAMGRQEAKSRVEEALANRYRARRTFKIMLPRKYVILEPGDVILVPFEQYVDRFYNLQLVEKTIGANGLIEAQFIDHHNKELYDAGVEADSEDFTDGDEPATSQRTRAYLLDIPLIKETEEDLPGFYVALCGANNSWSGGLLLFDTTTGAAVGAYGASAPLDAGGGTNYLILSDVYTPAPHGYALTVLGPCETHLVWDRESTVIIKVLNSNVILNTFSEDLVMTQPVNRCLIGNEMLQFATATDKGNGIWELSKLLRGQRGTEMHTGTHAGGELFLRLLDGVIDRIEQDEDQLNVAYQYLSVSNGQDIATGDGHTFTNTGNSLRPFAPAIISSYRTNTPDVVINWLPRLRTRTKWFPTTDVFEVDQPYEKYEIDVIYNGLVERTVALSDVRTWTYTGAMRTADGRLAADVMTFKIYQMGQIVGRGLAAELEV